MNRDVVCAICRTADVDGGWVTFPLVLTLNGSDVLPTSKAWAGRTIEVRECPRCSRTIARAPRRDPLH